MTRNVRGLRESSKKDEIDDCIKASKKDFDKFVKEHPDMAVIYDNGEICTSCEKETQAVEDFLNRNLDESTVNYSRMKRVKESSDGFIVRVAFKGPSGDFDSYAYCNDEDDPSDEYFGYDSPEDVTPMELNVAKEFAKEVLDANCTEVMVGVVLYDEAVAEYN